MLRIACTAIAMMELANSVLIAQQSLPAPQNYPPGVIDVTPVPVRPLPTTPVQPPIPPQTYSTIDTTTCSPPPLPSFLVSVEYLLVRPRRADLEYAGVDHRNNLIPEGHTASLNWDTRSGFRFGFLWRPLGGPNDLAFTYTYVYSNDSEGISAPNGGVLFPLLTRPGRIDEVRTATAFSSLNYNVFDIDFGRRIVSDDCFYARVFAGARIADIGQVLEATYDGLDAHQAMARHRTQMDGGGLTAGGEARWLFANGWSAYGRGRGSLVVADYNVCAHESDFAGNVLVTDVNDSFTKVVPVLDLGVGITWRRRNWHASLGYEISHWFNQAETITFLDDFSEGKRVRRTADLSLEAITFQLGLEF